VILSDKAKVTIRNMVTEVHLENEIGTKMNIDDKRRMTFPLRLAGSLKNMAHHLAQQDGISLNHFISIAVAEKISRLESGVLSEHTVLVRQQKLAVASGIISKTLYS
jgi:HicB family